MESFDVVISGAGPTGTHLAYLLSKNGLSVLILEKKKVIGKSACSGLISTRLRTLVPLKKSVIEHVVFGATFHSKKASFSVEKSKPVAYVINRAAFDRELAAIAQKAGAQIHTGEPFEEYSLEGNCIIVNKKYSAKVLVGADGAGSTVRRLSGLEGKISFVNGIISIIEEPSGARTVDVFYGKSIAPGFFAWKIPRGKSTEYGLAAKRNHLQYFRKFLGMHGHKMAMFRSHPIVSGEQQTAGERVILLGDAALQVKPFSGGGVIYGLMCAKIAAKAISSAFKKNDFSKKFFQKNYDIVWKKKLQKPLMNGKMLRELLNALDDRELDTFFRFLDERKDALSSFGDMDFLQ
ncbi:Digeranylgeranylglycerophospholipid reductase [uncultured archaeon]|nr:Digeranylgeranylglycerophospholipid reductase [uncultured archaeon]